MINKLLLIFLVVWMLLLAISQGFLANALTNNTITLFKQEQDIMMLKEWKRDNTVTHAPTIPVLPNTPGMKDQEPSPIYNQ